MIPSHSRLLALAALLAVTAAMASAPSAQQAGPDVYVVQSGDTLFRIARSNGLTVEALQRLNGLQDTYITVGQALRLSERVPRPAAGTTPTAPRSPSDVTGVPIPDRPTPDRPAPERPATPRPATPRPATPERPIVTPTVPTPDATPATSPSVPAGRGTVHVVAAGETLFRIALRYDTSVEAIRRLNGIDSDLIEVGQRLVVAPGAGGVAGGAAPPRPGGASRPVQLTTSRTWSMTNTTVPADLVHFVEPGETLYSIAAHLGLRVDDLAGQNALSTAPLEPGTLLYLPESVNPASAALTDLPPPVADGLALVYPDVLQGRATASGEVYDPLDFTASHRDYPFGTLLLVTNPTSGRSTFVRVIDRGPVSQSYLLELSAAAASALELDPNAARRVELREVP